MNTNASDARDAEIKALALRQWRDYAARTPGTYFGEGARALTLEEAYGVQFEVVRLRCEAGDAVAGYKVGCVGEGVVEQFGMSGPIHARVFQSELRAAGDHVAYGDFSNLAIEGEMAVRIGADGGIADAFPIVELHHFVFRSSPKTLVELIANNGIHGGVVLPPASVMKPLDAWSNAATLSVAVDGREIDRGALWSMPGGAYESVEWLRAGLARHGIALKEGDLVLTATPLGLHPVKPGSHVAVLVDGVEHLRCHVV